MLVRGLAGPTIGFSGAVSFSLTQSRNIFKLAFNSARYLIFERNPECSLKFLSDPVGKSRQSLTATTAACRATATATAPLASPAAARAAPSAAARLTLLLRCSSQPSHRPTLLISCTEQLNSSVRSDAALTATVRRTASSAGQGGWPEHLSRPRRF